MNTETFNLSAFLPYRLAVLSERVSKRLSVEYQDLHGATVAEWRVLVHLLRCKAVSIREIHNCVNLDKPKVSRAVTRLEAAGLVQKVPDTEDARLVSISLTPDGHAALDDLLPRVLQIESSLLAAIDPQELASFLEVMEKIHSVLDSDDKARKRSRMDLEGIGDEP